MLLLLLQVREVWTLDISVSPSVCVFVCVCLRTETHFFLPSLPSPHIFSSATLFLLLNHFSCFLTRVFFPSPLFSCLRFLESARVCVCVRRSLSLCRTHTHTHIHIFAFHVRGCLFLSLVLWFSLSLSVFVSLPPLKFVLCCW